jgi:hypothetical protein
MDMARLQRQAVPSHVAAHFKAHASSGKTIKEYSKEAGLSPLTFYTWRKKYKNRKTQCDDFSNPASIPQLFSTIGTISLPKLHQPLFDIHLGAEKKITVYSGAKAQELAPFLELLSTGRGTC